MLERKKKKDSKNHDPSIIEASEVEAISKQNRTPPCHHALIYDSKARFRIT